MNKMLGTKLRFATVTLLGAALLLAACAKSSTPSSGGTTAAPAPSTAATAVAIHTATVGSVGVVLEDATGFTLYHNTLETPGKIVCTGGCESVWPPVLLPAGTASAMAGMGLHGGLGTIKRPDGTTQVIYKGMPLYRYSGDTAAGQDNGEGIENVWFAAKASGSGGTTPASVMPTPTSSKSSGGYGY
jgi:predicted lipoprotein with Yx(FWY)xxD motif